MTTYAAARWEACRSIDQAAGEARSRYVAVGFGQEEEYRRKLEEAGSYLAAAASDPYSTVPAYIAAEASALGRSAGDVAAEIVARASTYHSGAGPAISGARRAGKVAVAAATDEVGIAAAAAAAISALAAL